MSGHGPARETSDGHAGKAKESVGELLGDDEGARCFIRVCLRRRAPRRSFASQGDLPTPRPPERARDQTRPAPTSGC